MSKDSATKNGRIKINSIEWFLPQYTPSISQQTFSLKQILYKLPKEHQYVERSVFRKEVKTQNLRSFQSGTQEGLNVSIFLNKVFQQRDRQDSEKLNKNTFHSSPVTSAQYIIGTEKYLVSALLLTYDDDDYSRGNGQI